MALAGISDDFELDDHGILQDSFASDFHVDDDGILHDDLDLFKHAVNTAGHGTDSGIGGDKQSSTSTLQHLHASFDEDLAPIGDESINISDFEASRDDLDSFEGDPEGGRRSRSFRRYKSGVKDLDTPGSTLERPQEYRSNTSGQANGGYADRENRDLFSEDYYQQLRDLGVLVDGADFSRDGSQTEFEALESHLSRGHITYDDDNRDLIGEYLQNEYERERAEEEEGEETDGRGDRNRSHAAPSSRANSAPTISEQSFPEISPEDADMMYTESQQTGDDDEIYLINHQLLPASSRIQAQKLPSTPSEPPSRPDSRDGQPQTPQRSDKRWRSRSKRSPSPVVGDREEQNQEFQRSQSQTNTPHRGRPDSAASHVSVASESARRASDPPTPGKSALSKAHSQESFFEQDKPQHKNAEKVPKRMLPTPGTPEGNQSFRVKSKSKSASNIANKSAPVKPTHSSISEATRATMDDSGDAGSGVASTSVDRSLDRSEGELTTQLKHESSKRQQATELVQQLQKEYDSLLSKYALAELTIDQMRLGARVTLHADSPTPTSVPSSAIAQGGGGHKAQMMQLPTPSAQRAVVGQFNAQSGDGQSLATSQVQTTDVRSRSASRADKPLAGGYDDAENDDDPDSEDRMSTKTPRTAESVKLGIQTQAISLNDRMDQFHALLENRQLTLEEQEKAFENIRTDHEKLRRSYLQAKEDYNVLKRSGASLPDTDFDQDKELEGQLFRLGMKFDEVHERVDSNLKEKTTQRKPFQTSRLADDDEEEDIDDENTEGAGDYGNQSGAAGGTEEAELEKRADQLHEEYRALMDRYRRLKQMAPTPELEKEKDNLVRKLNEICTEMPDTFRLAPELQDRYKKWKTTERLKIYDRLNNVWERLHRRDQRRSPLPQGGGGEEGAVGGQRGFHPSVPPGPKARGLPVMGDHSISPYMSGHQGGRESHMDDSFRRTPNSLNNSRASMASPVGNSSAAPRSSFSPSPQDRDRQGSPSSLDGAAAPRDRDHYDPRINRPRRHQHDFHDPKLSKMPDRGSYSSLPDSGISDHDGRDHRPDEALAHLPGPGKLKQMTHQRGDNDLDSGFIGSVVSSDGTHRQLESPLRLRDRNQNRTRPDSTGSTSSAQQDQDNQQPPRQTKRPTAVPALVGIRRESVDRSYDGELDESTLSDTHTSSRDVRPKLSSRQASGDARRGRMRGEASAQSQSVRSTKSQSRTVDDVCDGEMSDASTPRHVESSRSARSQPPSSQQTKALHTSYRPPTPHQPPTPQRPPTPYHVDEEEVVDGNEVNEPETAPPQSERIRLRRPSDDEVVQRRMQQRRSRSPAPQQNQRPQSRGTPTTDLYHTRPRVQDRESAASARSSRPGPRYDRHGTTAPEPTRGDERGVGSDVEIRSDATRGSSINSARLRAMQDEIDRLKEGMKQAHEKMQQRPEPAQAQQPEQQQGQDYYDPFDDPYGFMRVPRRRANSFSGGRVREFDDWYMTLPNDRRNDDADIPLGYAAADAYNRHHQDKTPEDPRHRLRHRGERRRRGEETYPKTVDEGGGVGGAQVFAAGPSSVGTAIYPTRTNQTRRPPTNDPQALYNYYVPSRLNGQQEYQNPNSNPYRQQMTSLSASQPNLAGTLAGVEPSNYPYQTQQKRPWYTIRRAQWPASANSGQYFPTTGNQARKPRQPAVTFASQPAPQNVGYYSSYPSSGSAVPAEGGVGYRVESCPLCGGAGAHIHEEDVEPVHGYMAQDFATQPGHERQGRPRQRSRSASRTRHYTPERSSSHSRYLVREFGDLSDESDLEPSRGRRRSRSLSRSRGHSETRSSSRRRGRRYRRDEDLYDSDEDVDLNESLVLSGDINRLTKRMIGTVQGELNKYKDRKEFGSSYW